MLTQNEIVVGNLYAWDTGLTEPHVGSNLFTILDSAGEYLKVRSIDGFETFSCGAHCLVTAEDALARLSKLESIDVEVYADSHKTWQYERAIKYLRFFKEAYDEYMAQNIATDETAV